MVGVAAVHNSLKNVSRGSPRDLPSDPCAAGDEPDMAEGLRIVPEKPTAGRIDFLRKQPEVAGPHAEAVVERHCLVQATLLGKVVDQPEAATQQKGPFVPLQAIWRAFGEIAIQQSVAGTQFAHDRLDGGRHAWMGGVKDTTQGQRQ